MAVSKSNYAVTRARTVLLVSQPFYGTLALQLNLVELPDDHFCKTMAVDGKNMFYNPQFVLERKEDELVGVVAHEVSHCAYKHMTRRGHRDPIVWNMAGDYVINQDLTDAGFVLPYKPSYLVKDKNSKEKVHLLDPKYKGMSTEEVYERLMENAIKISIISMGTGPDGQPGVQDVGGCGGVLDAAKPHDKAAAEEIGATWEANVRMAVAVATAQNAGKLPGHLERLVKQLKKPKVSWRDYTHRFIDNSMTKDFSWARPNRRSMSSGVLLPGYIADRIHHLVGCVDISGSVSHEMMVEMVSELGGALDEGVADKLTIIYFDDGVKKVDEFDAGDLVHANAPGGGGTNFRPTFDHIRENIPDASCVIFLTDLMTTDWGDEPNCPVMWGVFLPESHYEQIVQNVPFGETIHVSAGR